MLRVAFCVHAPAPRYHGGDGTGATLECLGARGEQVWHKLVVGLDKLAIQVNNLCVCVHVKVGAGVKEVRRRPPTLDAAAAVPLWILACQTSMAGAPCRRRSP